MGGTPNNGLGGSASSEHGAALVEAAFITALLLMILLGTVTAGLTYGRSNALQTAAREATRFGATLPDDDIPTWLNQVMDVAVAAATGDLDTGTPGRYLCVALIEGGDQHRLQQTGDDPRFQDTGDCYPDGRPSDEDRVQVLVRRTSEIQVAVFSIDVTLESPAAARYER